MTMTAFEAQLAIGRGQMTVDAVVAGIKDRSIELPPMEPPVDGSSPTWWFDVEARRPFPFSALRAGDTISKEQFEQLREAIYEVRGAKYDGPLGSSPIDIDVALEGMGLAAPDESPVEADETSAAVEGGSEASPEA